MKKGIAWLTMCAVVCTAVLYAKPTQAKAPELWETTNETLVMCVGSPMVYVNNVRQWLDEEVGTAVPIIKEDRAFVPGEAVAKALGATATYQEDAQQMTVTLNGQTVSLGVTLVNDQPYVAVRELTEAFNKSVFYDRGLLVISETNNTLDAVKDKQKITNWLTALNNLPAVGTKEKYVSLLNAANGPMLINDRYSGVMDEADDGLTIEYAPAPQTAAAPAATANKEAASNDTSATTGSGDFSQTNVQVEGVDEGDIIKTDGNYIYIIKSDKIVVVKAVPPENMTVDFEVKPEIAPQEIYIDGNTMVVIGTSYQEDYGVQPLSSKMVTDVAPGGIYGTRWQPPVAMTTAIQYDISNRKNIQKVREVQAEGNYITSRKTGKDVYLITQLYTYGLYDGKEWRSPFCGDTAAFEGKKTMAFNDIYYFPDKNDGDMMTLTGFSVDRPREAASQKTYLGAGENVYMSKDRLYIAAADYYYNDNSTSLYQFALNKGNMTFVAKGMVPGQVLNQFSMDEKDGYFRIATTGYDKNWNETNSLYVLSQSMDIVGKIENIARGERIYSVRFMGERAYMVTFKTVDPLFVIDVADPTNPQILGALKIPGYSDYLHPYDETHLIGFGKDATVVKDTAYYQGMKVAMFDVSDVANPKEMFNVSIGDRGTESPVLFNHKALLFDKKRNIMAFPVTVMETKDKYDPLAWGQFAFQGLYVYGIDLKEGFTEKGRITHLSKSDMLKSSSYGGEYERYIERAVTIGDNVYTASQTFLKATSLNSMEDIGQVKLD